MAGQRSELLRTQEVAAIFRVHPSTIGKWARSGKLTYVQTLGGHKRFLREEVEHLMAELGIPGATPP